MTNDNGPVFDGVKVGRPATGGLLNAGYTSVQDLPANLETLLEIHGVGPKAVRLLDEARAGAAGVGLPSQIADLVTTRSDGRDDGDDWDENYEELPGGANISIILESTSAVGVGPRLHLHPYAETFLIRRGSATFTIGAELVEGRAGQVLVVPADTPHKFATGPDGYEAVHIHANPRFVTEWLE